ncbi:hypothetical protein D3C73_1359450 [compost metagenome]
MPDLCRSPDHRRFLLRQSELALRSALLSAAEPVWQLAADQYLPVQPESLSVRR